jgi:uncharacterized membrane protein YfcA
MSLLEITVLLAAALIAGVMNAIAGGGTLLTFPALLAFGMPAIRANATSTLALMVGIIGSTYGYRAHLPVTGLWLRRFGVVSVTGSLIGAALLTCTPEKAFERLVPFLLLFATVLFMAQSAFVKLAAREARVAAETPAQVALAAAGMFLVAIYGGYFGAGIGILMLSVLGLMGMRHIHEMNAVKTVVAVVINLVATGYFIFAGLIEWPQALVMTAGATAGYFSGAHFAQRVSQAAVRRLITAIGFTISAVLFWKQFA